MTGSANVPLAVSMMIIVAFVAIGLVLIPSLEEALRRRIARTATDRTPNGEEPVSAPYLVAAARRAPDRLERIALMAEIMVEQSQGPEEACTYRHLYARGLTEAEVEAYRDDARAMIEDRPSALRTMRPHTRQCAAMVEAARTIRRIRTGPSWSKPQIQEQALSNHG